MSNSTEILTLMKGLKSDVYRLQEMCHGQRQTVEKQNETINLLMAALCDKYDHGFFIIGSDTGIPRVISNGKELTDKFTTSFSIEWTPEKVPTLHIEQYPAMTPGA